MNKLQEVFKRLQESKEELKKLKKIYRDALDNSQEYKESNDELKIAREKKKSLEDLIKSDFQSEISKQEELKASIADDQMLLSDLALTKVSKGESIEIDDDNIKYEPIFSVKFKKVD